MWRWPLQPLRMSMEQGQPLLQNCGFGGISGFGIFGSKALSDRLEEVGEVFAVLGCGNEQGEESIQQISGKDACC